MTPADLVAFEADIAAEFAAGNIHAPIHLGGGNEKQLIEIFKSIHPQDWVLCGWRSHFHCLLKGVPPAELKAKIMAGHSVGLCFPEHKILSSGIVGGTAPIAVGLAMASARVHVFIGDMSAETGIVYEAQKYAARHRLKVRWICEDNGKSVCSDTQQTWGEHSEACPDAQRYCYELTRPHSGIGTWIRF